MTHFDLQAIRKDTPSCEQILHLNNAGASLKPQVVTDAIIQYLHEEDTMGGYEAANHRAYDLEETYSAIAQFINASPEEIAFMESATRAWDMAFYSIPFEPGDKILTAVSEYASNYIPFLQLTKKRGIQIEVIPNDESGQLSVDALSAMIDSRVKLIAVTHIPTNGGLINPAVEIGKIARKNNILYLLDACQSVGHIPIDVAEIGCDMLSATGRKYLRGPRGTGFLYVRKNLISQLEPVFLDLHAATWTTKETYKIRDDARRFEAWESSYAGKLGLKTAVQYASHIGIEAIWQRIQVLSTQLRESLSQLPKVHVQDLGTQKCGIVSFTVDGFSPEMIQQALRNEKINVSISTKDSTLIDMQMRKLESTLRASVHYYNAEKEIERFIKALDSIISG